MERFILLIFLFILAGCGPGFQSASLYKKTSPNPAPAADEIAPPTFFSLDSAATGAFKTLPAGDGQKSEKVAYVAAGDTSTLGDLKAALGKTVSAALGESIQKVTVQQIDSSDVRVNLTFANASKPVEFRAKLTQKNQQMAVQGPHAVELASRIFPGIENVMPFHFTPVHFKPAGASATLCFAARTGYTGEDGFEIFVPTEQAVALWRMLLEKGEDLDARPIGLGARDTLRTEMKYSLYGQEIDDKTNPFAAGLGWVVKPDAKDFIGKNAILAARERGLTEKLVGFKMIDKGIPRHDYRVLSVDSSTIGRVTSGTVSPTLNESIGIAYVRTEFSKVGTEFLIDIRGRGAKAKVVEAPFVTTALTKKREIKKEI